MECSFRTHNHNVRLGGGMGRYMVGAVLFLALGGFLFWRYRVWLGALRRQIAAAQHWPEANARVDFAGARNLQSTSEILRDFLLAIVFRYFGGGSSLSAVVEYRFEIGGQIYQGNRLAFGRLTTSSERLIETLVKPYPKGSVTRIRYNPQDPRDNVVQPRELLSSQFRAIIGPMTMGLGVILLLVGLTK
jgi:hypothetical protein